MRIYWPLSKASREDWEMGPGGFCPAGPVLLKYREKKQNFVRSGELLCTDGALVTVTNLIYRDTQE